MTHLTGRIAAVAKAARTRALLSLGIVLGLTSTSTLAFWTDTTELSTGTIQSGTLDIQLNHAQSHQATTFAIADMIPGESVAYGVNVHRAVGSIAFTYTVTGRSTATNTFAQDLVYTVHAGTGTQTSTTNGVRRTVCTGADLSGGGSTLAAAATTLVSERVALATPIVVSDAVITDPVCIQAALPAATGNEAQGKATTAVFDFTATQLRPGS